MLLSTINQAAHADAVINWNKDGQEFVSESKRARVQVQLEKTELLVTTEKKQRHLKMSLDLLRTGNFFLSDNGEWIVWVLKSMAALFPDDPKNPVIVIFRNDKELKRFGLKDIGELKLSHTVSHVLWIDSAKVDFGQKKVYLLERGDTAREFAVNWGNGKVESKTIVKPLTPQESATKTQKDYVEAMQVYSKEMQSLMDWYTEENKKLAAQLDVMSDAEVNAQADKLRANYNRQLIKLQARMPKAP